jgi:predicted dehydrogenase
VTGDRVESFAAFERNQMFLDELQHFFAALRGEVEPLVSLRDARDSLRVSVAALRSLESGTAQEIHRG